MATLPLFHLAALAMLAFGQGWGVAHAASLRSTGHAPVLTTECGPVLGTYDAATDVASFRGIRYAHPPTRWAPPVPLTPDAGTGTCWAGLYNATQWANGCIQSGQFQHGGSEDCLFLNVWIPQWSKFQPSARRTPIMAYSYGGDLTDGNSADYDFTALAGASEELPLIVVSFNYRVNVFGFLALSQLSATSASGASGNYGFMDQILALKWIQKNAQYLGGDAGRVTFAGQSSGGTSLYALLASPAARGLFSRGVSYSGSVNMSVDLHTAEQQNADLVQAAGCNPSASAEAVVACLRGVSTETLVEAIPARWNSAAAIWSFPPASAATNPRGLDLPGIAIVDGDVVQASLLDALKQGLVDVPLIITSMAAEPDAQPGQLVGNLTSAAFQAQWNAAFAPWGADMGARIAAQYPVEAQESHQLLYDVAIADYGQTCSSRAAAAAATAGFKSPVYQVVFNHSPSKPVWNFDPAYAQRWPFHSWDILSTFMTYDIFSPSFGLPTYQPSAEDAAWGALVRQMLLEFAHAGRLDAQAAWGWAPFGTGGVVGVFNTTGVTGVPNYKAGLCQWWLDAGFGPGFWWSN